MKKKNIVPLMVLSGMLLMGDSASAAQSRKMLPPKEGRNYGGKRLGGRSIFLQKINDQLSLLADLNNEPNVAQALRNLKEIVASKMAKWQKLHPTSKVCKKAPCPSTRSHPK